MSKTQNKIIFNSSPLINLAKINCLNLIEEIYNKIIIPEAVYSEVVDDASTKYKGEFSKIASLTEENVIEIKSVENREFVRAFRTRLDLGEAEVLSLALEINTDLVVIDEMEAREIADDFNLRKTGFLGILLKADEKELIDSGINLLDEAVNKDFHISDKLYDKIKRQFRS